MTRSSLLGCAFLLASLFPCVARDIAGADQALARFKTETSQPAAPDAGPDAVQHQFKEHLRELTATVATLPPEEAATRWLALVDEWRQVQAQHPSPSGWIDSRTFNHLLAALPPPAAWDALDAAVAGRKPVDGPASPAYLRMLTTLLRGDIAGSKAAAATWRKAAPDEHDSQGEIEKSLATLEGNALSPAAEYEAKLTAREKGDEDADLYSLPDLVAEMGAAKAEALLKRVLVRRDITLSEVEGDETRRLAVKVALGLKDRLAGPQWVLIRDTSAESMALHAELERKFPRKGTRGRGRGDYQRPEADGYYLRHLILTGKTAEATRLAQSFTSLDTSSSDAFPLAYDEDLSRDDAGRKITAFLTTLLDAHPELPYWDSLVKFAGRFGAGADAGRPGDPPVALLTKIFARTDLPAPARQEVGTALLQAHLTMDQPEEAVKVLRVLLAEKLAAMAGPVSKGGGRSDSPSATASELACQLIELGRLLKNEEWIGQGITDGRAAFAKSIADGNADTYGLNTFTKLLFKLNRPAEAEDLLVSQWIKQGREDGSSSSYWSEAPVEMLASYYHRLGRHADVVKLMEEGTGWKTTDLGIFSESGSFLLPAAQSLAALGRKEEARRILLAYLPRHGDDDAAYELLLALGGDVTGVLDAQFARNRFEERPLIWKAKLLLDGGHPDEAEKTIRAAIAVDPSDGEQGKGDRLRAYAVLADVVEKKGDAAQAATLRTAVSAIRLSEDADDFRYAGLRRRAIAMYERSLDLFADAYCIQSRLALTYEAAGDLPKAEEHYQRAYELMPDSFGAVESHCFGCEGIFSERGAQGIAERVFTRLAAQPGAKAQVFYLLGYLRDEQDRHQDALAQYRRAVQLDPDYANAWKKIIEGSDKSGATRAVLQEAELNLLRLSRDVSGAHLQEITDFRALWPLLESSAQAEPPPSGRLFEFKATKAAVAASPRLAQRMPVEPGDTQRGTTAGELLEHHDTIRTLLRHAGD